MRCATSFGVRNIEINKEIQQPQMFIDQQNIPAQNNHFWLCFIPARQINEVELANSELGFGWVGRILFLRLDNHGQYGVRPWRTGIHSSPVNIPQQLNMWKCNVCFVVTSGTYAPTLRFAEPLVLTRSRSCAVVQIIFVRPSTYTPCFGFCGQTQAPMNKMCELYNDH